MFIIQPLTKQCEQVLYSKDNEQLRECDKIK